MSAAPTDLPGSSASNSSANSEDREKKSRIPPPPVAPPPGPPADAVANKSGGKSDGKGKVGAPPGLGATSGPGVAAEISEQLDRDRATINANIAASSQYDNIENYQRRQMELLARQRVEQQQVHAAALRETYLRDPAAAAHAHHAPPGHPSAAGDAALDMRAHSAVAQRAAAQAAAAVAAGDAAAAAHAHHVHAAATRSANEAAAKVRTQQYYAAAAAAAADPYAHERHRAEAHARDRAARAAAAAHHAAAASSHVPPPYSQVPGAADDGYGSRLDDYFGSAGAAAPPAAAKAPPGFPEAVAKPRSAYEEAFAAHQQSSVDQRQLQRRAAAEAMLHAQGGHQARLAAENLQLAQQRVAHAYDAHVREQLRAADHRAQIKRHQEAVMAYESRYQEALRAGAASHSVADRDRAYHEAAYAEHVEESFTKKMFCGRLICKKHQNCIAKIFVILGKKRTRRGKEAR